MEKETYRLERTESGEFPLPVERRNNFNESAVYYVLHNGGKYVFRIEYPLRADTSGVTAEQVEAVHCPRGGPHPGQRGGLRRRL